MTSHTENEWQHNDCIWHDTQCICVIKPTWLMTSQPMYIWNHTHYMYDTIGTLYDITSTLAVNTQSFLYHGTHFVYDIIYIIYYIYIIYIIYDVYDILYIIYYIWCHPYCVYDYQCSISDLKPIKTDIASSLYAITPSLLKTSHLLCKTSQVAYVCHHMRYIGHHIHTLWQQPLLFMTSHALYSLHHTHYIWHLIYSVWCHIHYVCYITQWLYLWHQTLYVYDIYTWYGITHCVMTTQPLCAFTATMPDITLSVFLTLHRMYQFYEKKWMYVITASICMTPYALHMISHPLFMTSYHCSYHITSTAFMTSHTLYMTSCKWQ